MKRYYLLTELILVFILLPALLSVLKPHGAIYFFMWVCTLLCLRWLYSNGNYKLRSDWNASALNRKNISVIITRFFICAIALFIFTYYLIPEHLFSLPRERPRVWGMVIVFYPLLSVIPQEIIFRSFFLKRYKALAEGKKLYVLSAITFGWMHIILRNPIAVVLSGIGGYMFAATYDRKESLALACLEHALYGCYIFTIGLGFFFYHGTMVK